MQGADKLLIAIFHDNYELCARRHESLIEALVREACRLSSVAMGCIDCLRCLVAVKQVPIQHSQYQILTNLNKIATKVLSGVQVFQNRDCGMLVYWGGCRTRLLMSALDTRSPIVSSAPPQQKPEQTRRGCRRRSNQLRCSCLSRPRRSSALQRPVGVGDDVVAPQIQNARRPTASVVLC